MNLSLETQGRFKDLKLEGCQFKEGGLGVALKVKRLFAIFKGWRFKTCSNPIKNFCLAELLKKTYGGPGAKPQEAHGFQ